MLLSDKEHTDMAYKVTERHRAKINVLDPHCKNKPYNLKRCELILIPLINLKSL